MSAHAPVVDVVVPVHGVFATTMHCLFSVLGASCRTPFEIVVVLMKIVVWIKLKIDAGWLFSVRMIGALTTLPLPSVSVVLLVPKLREPA